MGGDESDLVAGVQEATLAFSEADGAVYHCAVGGGVLEVDFETELVEAYFLGKLAVEAAVAVGDEPVGVLVEGLEGEVGGGGTPEGVVREVSAGGKGEAEDLEGLRGGAPVVCVLGR